MDIRTLCLGVLSRGDATGYEIKKAFEEGPFGHIHAASFGAIYPALGALSDEGMVLGTEQAQEKRPDKKVFSITAQGRAALDAALLAPPGDDKVRSDFLFILFFANHLPVAHLAGLIDRRIAWYRDTLARMETCGHCAERPGEVFVHGLGLTIYRTAAEYLSANRGRFLDQVSAANHLAAE